MPAKAPPKGVPYKYFVVPTNFEEDVWVQAAEAKPGNPSVVHHIIVYLVPPGVTPSGQAGRLRSNWLGAYAPGLRQSPLPEGYARFVQKGTKLMFEMHYTANGSKQLDRSYAGFVFADPKTVKKEVRGAIKEGQDGGQNSGDSGGSHAPMPLKVYTEAEKNACSIEAMRNGGTCEACQ